MICPNCGFENKPEAKFCTKCGSRFETPVKPESLPNQSAVLQEPKKSGRNTRMILIGLIVVLIIAGGTGGFWIASRGGSSSKNYQEALAAANRYYGKLDYVQAEEYYLKAMEIAPKEKEPYIMLYEVYIYTEEPQKAADILVQAEEFLEPEIFEEVKEEAITIEADQEEKVLQASLIDMPEIANMNWIPMNLKDVGWVVRIGENYGLYSPEEEWLVEPKYTYCEYLLFMEGVNFGFKADDQELSNSYYSSKHSYSSCEDGVSYTANNGLGEFMSGFGGATGASEFAYQGQPYVAFQTSSDVPRIEPIYGHEYYQGYTLILSEKKDDLSTFGEYGAVDLDKNIVSVFIEPLNKMLGPYPKEDCLIYHRTVNEEFYSVMGSTIGDYRVEGLFALKQSDGTWTLYNEAGTKSLEGFESVELRSDTCAVAKLGDEYLVIDQDLNICYISKTNEVSSVINGKALIKNGDSWYMIEVQTPDTEEVNKKFNHDADTDTAEDAGEEA